MAAPNAPQKIPPKDFPKDLADLDLASLQIRRAEVIEKQKETSAAVQVGKARHFLRFWLGGGVMLLAAVWLAQGTPEVDGRVGMFLFSTAIVLWLGMWIAAFLSTAAMRRLQDQATAANGRLVEMDLKIAFCHQVLEEAKKTKVQKYAQALVEKEAS